MNFNPTLTELSDFVAVCKMIGSVADATPEFQKQLFVNLELYCKLLSELSDGHKFYSGDLSIYEFVKTHADTLEQFTAPQQDSISVPASNPVEGQLIYAGVNSTSLKAYEKGYAASAAAIRFELSTKTGDNSK